MLRFGWVLDCLLLSWWGYVGFTCIVIVGLGVCGFGFLGVLFGSCLVSTTVAFWGFVVWRLGWVLMVVL